VLALAIGGWALSRVDGHEGRLIRVEEKQVNSDKNQEAFKDDMRRAAERAELEMRRLNEKVDRISEAVGAKKP